MVIKLICLYGCEYFLFVAYLVFKWFHVIVGLIYFYCRMMPKEILKLMEIVKQLV
jgi:hypothetical protein